ncbi:MAG: ImmA/IrrE family metallo-endopeptidase [Acidobacteriota bacterium]
MNELVRLWRGSIVVATPEDKWESLRIEENKTFTIFLSPETSPLRDNFTIAHELGHLLLHTNFKEPGIAQFNRFGSDRAETEANWFAANLLMPREEFIAAAEECGHNPYILAGRFGVSVAAANVRLSALKLS